MKFQAKFIKFKHICHLQYFSIVLNSRYKILPFQNYKQFPLIHTQTHTHIQMHQHISDQNKFEKNF